MGFKLDSEALTELDGIVAKSVRDPVGPEFMAPPEQTPEEFRDRSGPAA
jgi:hypothetical protein